MFLQLYLVVLEWPGCNITKLDILGWLWLDGVLGDVARFSQIKEWAMLGTLSMILVFYLCLPRVINPQLSGAIYTDQSCLLALFWMYETLFSPRYASSGTWCTAHTQIFMWRGESFVFLLVPNDIWKHFLTIFILIYPYYYSCNLCSW